MREFGAAGNGMTLDTQAIQKALDACGKGGGGTVLFPPGTYLSRPLKIRSKTTVLLEAGATLLASTNQSDFMKMPGDWLKAKSGGDFVPFIGGKDLTDVTFTGEGTIDGNGAVWWERSRKSPPETGYTLPRPNLIVLNVAKTCGWKTSRCKTRPNSILCRRNAKDVVVSNVTILAPEHAANTDAIDPSVARTSSSPGAALTWATTTSPSRPERNWRTRVCQRRHHGNGLHLSARPRHVHRQRNRRRRAQRDSAKLHF